MQNYNQVNDMQSYNGSNGMQNYNQVNDMQNYNQVNGMQNYNQANGMQTYNQANGMQNYNGSPSMPPQATMLQSTIASKPTLTDTISKKNNMARKSYSKIYKYDPKNDFTRTEEEKIASDDMVEDETEKGMCLTDYLLYSSCNQPSTIFRFVPSCRGGKGAVLCMRPSHASYYHYNGPKVEEKIRFVPTALTLRPLGHYLYRRKEIGAITRENNDFGNPSTSNFLEKSNYPYLYGLEYYISPSPFPQYNLSYNQGHDQKSGNDEIDEKVSLALTRINRIKSSIQASVDYFHYIVQHQVQNGIEKLFYQFLSLAVSNKGSLSTISYASNSKLPTSSFSVFRSSRQNMKNLPPRMVP